MQNKDTRIKIFTYGTLKRGGGLNAYWMKKAKFITEDTVKGELYSLGAYPALFRGDKDVPGEVFSVPLDDYDIMREMEESAGFEASNAITKSGESVKIFLYRFSDVKKKENLILEW